MSLVDQAKEYGDVLRILTKFAECSTKHEELLEILKISTWLRFRKQLSAINILQQKAITDFIWVPQRGEDDL